MVEPAHITCIMKRAFILGGTGQIGRAACKRLLTEGWSVTLASRSSSTSLEINAHLKHITLDRTQNGKLSEALGDGVNLLLDCIAYDPSHADQLLEVESKVENICVISSSSVYQDEDGRTLDEALFKGFPTFQSPIATNQPTVDAGESTYSTRKIAMEQRLLDRATVPITILRPGAVYGPYGKHAREWFFVKRLLDGRRKIPLAYEGKSQFNTCSVEIIAEVILASASNARSTIMNVADPIAPTVSEIGEAIMRHMGMNAEIVGLADVGYPPRAGASPWAIPRPIIITNSDSGVQSPGNYEDLVGSTVDWLIAETNKRPWQEVVPELAAYPFDLFDYDAEDRAILAESPL